MSRGRWGRQIVKPSASGSCMNKSECVCKCKGADKGMGGVTKQTQTRNNKSENEKIYTRHTQVKRHKNETRTHKKHTTNSSAHQTPSVKQVREKKQQEVHPHGWHKQRISKTRKSRKQNRQLKQSTKTKKEQVKHNKQAHKILMVPIRPGNTVRST